jgi:hypothetical protein
VLKEGEIKNVRKVVVGTPEEDRPLRKIAGLSGRLILKICLKLVRWENVDWICLAHGKN